MQENAALRFPVIVKAKKRELSRIRHVRLYHIESEVQYQNSSSDLGSCDKRELSAAMHLVPFARYSRVAGEKSERIRSS